MTVDRNTDEDMLWSRSGASFREACSRGSQTTTDDFEEEFHQESHPATPAANVRRASFLLGDLRTIYSPPEIATTDFPPPVTSVQPEVRCPPRPSNPWCIHYRDNVLPELDRACQYRAVCNKKCLCFMREMAARSMARCFLCWRKSSLRHLTKTLSSTIEKNNTNFYKQRRVSLVKVWSHISIGLSNEEVLQRGTKELASETIAQRLLRKHKGSATITTEIIDEEINHMAGIPMDTWLSNANIRTKTTYLLRWRECRHLPRKFFNKKLCRAVISCWRSQSKANTETETQTTDDSRYEEAKSFHYEKTTKAVMQQWNERSTYTAQRRRTLFELCRVCLQLSQSIEDKQMENKRGAFLQWTTAVETNRVYRALPFQQWRDLTLNEKYRSRVQSRLLFVYLRAKMRRQLWSTFRLWKHQSKYGRVTALYTRNELASGWMEQKQRCERLAFDIHDGKADQVRRLEEQLRQSEDARHVAERELSELRDANNDNSALFSGTSPFRESLEALYPLLMHGKNIL